MTKIIQRHDTSTNWTSVNPVLSLGEMGIETDTNKFKFGDGVTTWSELAYSSTEIDLSDYYDKETTDALLDTKQDVLTAGTNITIENNVISATGGGGADLTNYYTKDETYSQEEVDTLLDGKEDKITTVEPLSLGLETVSPTVGMVFTENNTKISPSVATTFTRQDDVATLGGQTWENQVSYIAIPYTIGDLFYIPNTNGSSTGSRWYTVLGKRLETGEFVPMVEFTCMRAYRYQYTTLYLNKISANSYSVQLQYYLPDYAWSNLPTGAVGLFDGGTTWDIITPVYYNSNREVSIKLNKTTTTIPFDEANEIRVYGDNISLAMNIRWILHVPASQVSMDMTLTDMEEKNDFNLNPVTYNYMKLKYDNQTIQVNSDGELVANLDELGNEVNAIAGRVTALENQSGGSVRNIGEIVYSTTPLTDAGLHLLDGALINGSGVYSSFVSYIAGLVTDYPDLFETEANWQNSVTTYGVCGKFVYDSVNNTVRLPKVTGIVEGTTDVTALGDLVQAGLPNIEGNFRTMPQHADLTADGAFSIVGWSGVDGGFVTNGGSYHGLLGEVVFNAGDSNSIYGNSSTVQPQSVKVLYYIVLANSTKTEIEIDIDQVTTDLNGKADVDLTNCTKPHIVETYRNGASWYRKWSDGFCEQGGYITGNGTYGVITVNLLVPFIDANYIIYGTQIAWDNSTWYTDSMKVPATGITDAIGSTQNKTTTTFQVQSHSGRYWLASGYIS